MSVTPHRHAVPMAAITTCTGTLVHHADGVHECDHGSACLGDRLAHDWVLECAELACDCSSSVLLAA